LALGPVGEQNLPHALHEFYLIELGLRETEALGILLDDGQLSIGKPDLAERGLYRAAEYGVHGSVLSLGQQDLLHHLLWDVACAGDNGVHVHKIIQSEGQCVLLHYNTNLKKTQPFVATRYDSLKFKFIETTM